MLPREESCHHKLRHVKRKEMVLSHTDTISSCGTGNKTPFMDIWSFSHTEHFMVRAEELTANMSAIFPLYTFTSRLMKSAKNSIFSSNTRTWLKVLKGILTISGVSLGEGLGSSTASCNNKIWLRMVTLTCSCCCHHKFLNCLKYRKDEVRLY